MNNVTLPKEFCFQTQGTPAVFITIVIIAAAALILYGLIVQISIHMCRVGPDEERQDRMDQTLGKTRIRAHFPATP